MAFNRGSSDPSHSGAIPFPSGNPPRASSNPYPFLRVPSMNLPSPQCELTSFSFTPELHLHLHPPTARHSARAEVEAEVDRRHQLALKAIFKAINCVCSLLVDEQQLLQHSPAKSEHHFLHSLTYPTNSYLPSFQTAYCTATDKSIALCLTSRLTLRAISDISRNIGSCKFRF